MPIYKMRIQKLLKMHYKKFLFNRQDCKRSETIILNPHSAGSEELLNNFEILTEQGF